jgi:RNA polymerase sigma-70 factor (ECF subfamily)
VDAASGHASDLAPNGWTWSLLRGFREGHRAALRDVYRMYADDVSKTLRFGFSFESRGRAHRFAGYPSGFELHDALHETFRRAFEPRARQGYDGLRPYGPYLKAIARNVVLRTFRAREVLFPPVDDGDDAPSPLARAVADDEGADPELRVGSEQIRDLVGRFLQTLDDDERELVRVRFIEGKSQRDAAEELGLGRQQVRGREVKVRKKLVGYLREHGEAGLVPALALLPLLACAATWLEASS